MRKKLALFTIIFILLNIIAYNLNSFNKKVLIKEELNKSIKDLKLHYNITDYYNLKMADNLNYTLSKNERVIAILNENLTASNNRKDELRKELYEILKDKFDSLKLEGVKILLFSEPNNKVFLRMHSPNNFGDDISSVRFGIVNVNRTKKEIHGFQRGRVSHAFRNIYPIFNDEGTYLGCFDVAFSSESMQEVLDRVNKIHSHFIVSKSVINTKLWKTKEVESEYKKSIEHTDFLVSEKKDVNHKKIEISKKTIEYNKNYINSKVKNSEEFAIVGVDNIDSVVISFLPIRSILGDKADAYIVSYTENPQILKIVNRTKWINMASFFFILIVLYLIYKQLVHKKELSKEVKKKTKELKDLNENLENKIEYETRKNREKDKQIYENQKNAQMGEMIGNIAHQWRQPLSLISTIASAQKLKLELELYEKEDAIKELSQITDTVQHLSNTIDIFRDYLKESKELKKVVLQDRIDYAIKIIDASLKNSYIEFINEMDYENKIEAQIVLGELSQVLINIFNNSKDAFENQILDKKWIKLNLYEEENKIIISIEDNAGGIPEEILPKIYDPYFTTKHQSQGTGIGLYMSIQIVQKHLNGNLYVKNTENGAKFFIELPNI